MPSTSFVWHLLVDLLDTDDQQIIDMILESNLNTGRLDFDSILRHHRVKNALLFGELWKEILGVYPCFFISKAFLDNHGEKMVEEGNFSAFVMSQFPFMLDHADIRQRLTTLTNVYDGKKMSILKIANRYGVEMHSKEQSLYSLYSNLTLPKSLKNTKIIAKALALETRKPIASLDDLFCVHHQCVNTLGLRNRNPFNGLGRSLSEKVKFRTVFDAFAYCYIEPSILLTILGAHTVISLCADPKLYKYLSECIPSNKVAYCVQVKPDENVEESLGHIIVFYHPLTLRYAPKVAATHIQADNLSSNCVSLTRMPRRTFRKNNIIEAGKLWMPMPIGNDKLLRSLSTVFTKSLFSHNFDANTLAFYQFTMRYYDKHRDTLMTTFEPSKNTDNVVVVVDTRDNIMSIMSILITFHNLRPNTWALMIFCIDSNIQYYDSIFADKSRFVEYVTHFDLTKSCFSIDAYNKLLKSVPFWDFIKNKNYRNVLLIQDDGMLVRKGLENAPFFGQTPYIGAPWCPKRPENAPLRIYTKERMIGNGGLSLRNTEAMLAVCKQYSEKNRELHCNGLEQEPEDVFFARHCTFDASSTFIAAQSFSTELILSMDSLGFHKFWMYHGLQDVLSFFNAILGRSHRMERRAFDLEYDEERESENEYADVPHNLFEASYSAQAI